MKIFDPHEYQDLAISFGVQHDRFNLLMSPGMGKTACSIEIMNIRSFVTDSYPALAIGPLRVANSVWNREVEKWANFKGLRVSKILGTLQERIAALHTPADIYTIHYGLLTWLHKYLEESGTKWFFKTVIADESTRLKHARPSFRKHPKSGKVSLHINGSANAGALARYAVRTPYWINMTGTYTPNGLQDAWGQQWFIDFGEALGSSYDAYTKRWFYQRRGTSAEQAVFEPHDHAMDEITRRLKPSSISIDAYDWFDVEKPREVDIEIEMPAKHMKEYRKLHREAMIKLENETVITAVNAGAITNKCMQYASGNIYDEDKNSHFIHSEKLDALESLMFNLNGAPLLVGYHYIPTREAILKRFPMAELLPSGAKQKDTEDRWNAGKIPMLVVHPGSAGHGLDLQHGGHHLCVVDPYWDWEMYAQLIERIGPVRQMQAGYDRLVHVFRLRMKNTFDDVVIDRLTSKASVESAVRGAMN